MLSRLSLPLVGLLLLTAGFGIAPGVSASGVSEFTARVSIVEGDVRVSLGDKRGPRLDREWVRAYPGMEMEEGYSVVTQEGNAEIELENGSVIYLAPRSLLMFYELGTLDRRDWGKPEYDRVRLGLIAGSAMFLSQFRDDGMLVVETPTGRLQAYLPALALITSYLNKTEAVHLVDLIPEELRLREASLWGPAQFVEYGDVDVKREVSEPESPWETRTKAKVSERLASTVEALRASGLDAPFEGLLELYGNGRFEDCGTGETCWSPSEKALAELRTPDPQAPHGVSGRATGPQSPGSRVMDEWDDWERLACPAVWTHHRLWRDANGKMHHDIWSYNSGATLSLNHFGPGPRAWINAACQDGEFRSLHNRHYIVLTRKHEHGHHHHHHEVCTQWVKVNGQIGFMRVRRTASSKDKATIDMKDGVYLMPKRPGEGVRHTDVEDPLKLTLLDAPPKEYGPEGSRELERIGKPVITAQYEETNPKVKAMPVIIPAGTLRQTTYDYAKHGFAIAGETKSAKDSGAVIVARMSPDGGLYAPGGRNSVQGVVTNAHAWNSGGGGNRGGGGRLLGTTSGGGLHSGGWSGGSSYSGGSSGGASTGSSHAPSAPSGGWSSSPPSGGGASTGGGGRPN